MGKFVYLAAVSSKERMLSTKALPMLENILSPFSLEILPSIFVVLKVVFELRKNSG